MIISTDNDNFSLTILLPGKESDPTSNINIRIANDESEKKVLKTAGNVSTMMVTCSGTLFQDEFSGKKPPTSAAAPLLSVHRKDFELKEHKLVMLEGLNQLREKGLLLDVTLWAENMPFQAHRVALASCSDYFRAMFTDPMRERLQADIYLAGISSCGLSVVLEYIYTSRVSLSLQNIHSVLSAASHLQVLQILDACSAYLEAQLDVENCIHILNLSETFGLVSLRLSAYRLISKSLSIFGSSQLFTLSHDQLKQLLSQDLSFNISELEILHILLTWMSRDGCAMDEKCEELLALVNFSDISQDDVSKCIDRHMSETNLPTSFLMKISKLKSKAYCEHAPAKSNGLVNFRGMELAMIKVGGISTRGVTNDLSYFFSTGTISQWLQLTRVPHLECSNFGCAVLNNLLYVVGGCFNQAQSLANFQEQAHPFGFCYNPQEDSWHSIAPMMKERCRLSLSAVGAKLYAVGGSCGSSDDLDNLDDDGNHPIDDILCEEYDINDGVWSPVEPMPGGPRMQHSSVGWNDRFLLVSGGLDMHHNVVDTLLVYDSQSRVWEPLGWRRMPTPRADHIMLVYNERVFLIGGWHYENANQLGRQILISNIDVYDMESDVWSVETQIPKPKFHSGITIIKDKLYIVGGLSSDILFDRSTGSVECYDLVGRHWSDSPSYPEDIWEHVCLPLYMPKGRAKLQF